MPGLKTCSKVASVLAAVATLGVGSVAFAEGAASQTTTSRTTTTQTTVTAGAAPVAPSAGYNLDTPIETIAADPAGLAVLNKDLPGLTTHPMYEQFKTMSLRQLQPMSEGKITDDALASTRADLAELPVK